MLPSIPWQRPSGDIVDNFLDVTNTSLYVRALFSENAKLIGNYNEDAAGHEEEKRSFFVTSESAILIPDSSLFPRSRNEIRISRREERSGEFIEARYVTSMIHRSCWSNATSLARADSSRRFRIDTSAPRHQHRKSWLVRQERHEGGGKPTRIWGNPRSLQLRHRGLPRLNFKTAESSSNISALLSL